MSVNKFRSRKFEEFCILNGNGNRIGWIRVKPSGILWAPKHKRRWFRVGLKKFAEFMVKSGRKRKK